MYDIVQSTGNYYILSCNVSIEKRIHAQIFSQLKRHRFWKVHSSFKSRIEARACSDLYMVTLTYVLFHHNRYIIKSATDQQTVVRLEGTVSETVIKTVY